MGKSAPIDTSGIELPADISLLLERLAQHNHDVWANQRLADGWTWGPERNDEARRHPDLVPYEQLTESARQYDRNAATETLKAIIALGYRIERA